MNRLRGLRTLEMVHQQWLHYLASHLRIMDKRVCSRLQVLLPTHHPRLLLLLCKINGLPQPKGTRRLRNLIPCLGQCRLWLRSIRPPPSYPLPQLLPIPWTLNGLVTIDRGRIREIVQINLRPRLSNSMLQLGRCIITICIPLMDATRVEFSSGLLVSNVCTGFHLCRVSGFSFRVSVCTYSRSFRSSSWTQYFFSIAV